MPLLRTTLLALPISLLAACGTPSIDADARVALLGLDGDILTDSAPGAPANSFQDLGLGDNEAAFGIGVNVKWGGPHVSIGTESVSYSGTGMIQSEIDIDGQTIPIGATVQSHVDLGLTNLLITWDVAPGNAVEVGLGFGVVAMDLEMRFFEESTSTTVSTEETIPIPVLAARVGLQSGPWEAVGVLAGLDVSIDDSSATFFDLDLHGKYHIAGGKDRAKASFTFGYRSLDLDLEYQDGGDRVEAGFGLTGPYLGLNLSF